MTGRSGCGVVDVRQQIQDTYYRARGDGVGYVDGEILRETYIFDVIAGMYTGSRWTNIDQLVELAVAPAAGDVEALDYQREVVGVEQLAVGAGVVGLGAVPGAATYAEVHVWDGPVVVRMDGDVPGVGAGYRQADGQTFELESRGELVGFRAVRLGAVDALLFVTYFRVYGGGGYGQV